ncbi:MAG: crossover junction endodeoxyribonuclease RuvC [Robiginitomaculum sp.]|nr:MAG: crossover junction endodeoxyribonuclease RuvC [Robiginitomaculum sp.]
MSRAIRILGLDPSLVKCGWGIVEAQGLKITHVAHGVIKPDTKRDMALRLHELHTAITDIIEIHTPDEAAVEDMFFKNNPNSAIKLGYARAMCLLAPAQAGLYVGEYSARKVKKSVVGTGGADKVQVAAMMNVLLPGIKVTAGDAADALAIAICHAHRASAAGALHRRFA